MGAVAGLIAHHTDGVTLAVEAAIALLVALLLGGIWLRERRRRRGRGRRKAVMRSSED
jgi:hypothetical protein